MWTWKSTLLFINPWLTHPSLEYCKCVLHFFPTWIIAVEKSDDNLIVLEVTWLLLLGASNFTIILSFCWWFWVEILKGYALSLCGFKYYFYLFIFCILRAAPEAYGGSQDRGLIRAVAASLRQSHRHVGSKLRLRPTAQLTATPDPSPTERGQGSNPQPHGS